jgi:RIP metalloprotease RseP
MELSEYSDRTPVFYNGVLDMGASNLAGLPEAGFILEIDGVAINNEAEVIKFLNENIGDESTFKVMDTSYNTDEYTGEVDENSVRDELFYVAIEEGSVAQLSNLPSAAYILAINGEEVSTQDEVKDKLIENESKSIKLKLETLSGEVSEFDVELGAKREDGRVVLGIYYGSPTEEVQSLGIDVNDLRSNTFETFYVIDYSNSSIFSGLFHTINVTFYQILGLGELISKAVGGQPGLLAESVGTPIKVGEFINAQVVSYSDDIVNKEFFINLLDLTGLLSATLAFMNMLPIPLVDGGQFVLLVFEKLRGRPLSDKKQEFLGKVGFIFLVVFSIVVLLKDFWQVILSKLF